MRSTVLAVVAALALSAGVFAQDLQTALPKCMQNAPPVNVDVRDVNVANVLPFLGASCGVEIRVEGIEATDAQRSLPRVTFRQAKVVDVFLLLVRSAGWKYSVLDDKTILVTKQ